MTTEIPQSSPDCEIVTSRTVNASKEQAFRAWSDPEHLKIWWGPEGFTNTFHEFDFQPGGKWEFTMHGPEKGHYQNSCEFIQITEPELIYWKRYSQPLFRVLVTFEAVSELKTSIIFKQIFDTAEACEKIKKHVIDKNEEVFDRLEEELAKM
ncbi:MAG: SRPBCC family protein [Fluviicola sp.]